MLLRKKKLMSAMDFHAQSKKIQPIVRPGGFSATICVRFRYGMTYHLPADRVLPARPSLSLRTVGSLVMLGEEDMGGELNFHLRTECWPFHFLLGTATPSFQT